MPTTAATETNRGQKARASTDAATAAQPAARRQQPAARQHRTPHQSQSSKALCAEIAQLLHTASQTDEPNEENGNSSRLLRVASGCAERVALLEWRDLAPENDIFDVAALMSAAERAPGDVAGPERTALVSQAWGLLLLVTGSEGRADLDDAAFVKPTAAAPNGLNAEQMEMVLAVIAGEAGTLCDLLLLSELGEENAKRTAFSAALIVAEGIGAKADTASGAGIRGDANMWHFGQSFDIAGSARGAT